MDQAAVEGKLAETAAALRNITGLHIVRTGNWLWVSGETREHKEELKALGLRFAPQKAKWYFAGVPVHSKKRMDWSYIVNKYGSQDLDKAI